MGQRPSTDRACIRETMSGSPRSSPCSPSCTWCPRRRPRRRRRHRGRRRQRLRSLAPQAQRPLRRRRQWREAHCTCHWSLGRNSRPVPRSSQHDGGQRCTRWPPWRHAGVTWCSVNVPRSSQAPNAGDGAQARTRSLTLEAATTPEFVTGASHRAHACALPGQLAVGPRLKRRRERALTRRLIACILHL